ALLIFLTAVLLLLTPMALLWALPLIAEVLALTSVRTRVPNAPAISRPKLLFLVPSHDEALLIEPCVQSLLRMSSERADSRFVVIADNCSDRTASIARAAGSEVLERTDAAHRGKPHAIE